MLRFTFKFFIWLLFFILLLGNCRQKKVEKMSNRLADILKTNTLRVATISNSVNYFIHRGEPLGFQYELARLFANEIGVKLKVYTKKSIQEVLESVKNGEYDVGAVDITKTLERNRKYNLTTHYGQMDQVLVQKDIPDKIESVLGLAGQIVHVVKHSSFEERLKDLSKEIGDSIIVKTIPDIDQEKAIKMVVDGEIKLTVADRNIAKVNKLYFTDLDVNTPISFPQYLCWSVPPNADNLALQLNTWMKKFRKTKKYKILYNKYFNNKRSKRIIKSDFYSKRTGKISPYDKIIKKKSKDIGWDWRLLASLIYQESKFNPDAISWAGASGLMQLMPKTKNAFGTGNTSDVYENLDAGIRYIRYLDKIIEKMMTNKNDKLRFILAAYNAGIGHLEDARNLTQKYGKNPDIWDNHVAYFMEMKSNRTYHTDPVVKYGYCRGKEVTQYVAIVLERYAHYKNFIEE